MITVSIVTFKTDIEELRKCLNSLKSPLISKIYVIDNSKEKYISDFCLAYNNISYIGSNNIGYGAGHNIALRQAINEDSKYHLVLNSDVYFEPQILDKIVDYMDKNHDVAQVHPNVIYPNGEMQYTCRLLPTPTDLIFRRFLPRHLVSKIDRRYLLKFNDHKKPMNVPYHQGSFMFFRTKCFNLVGLFDERFFMYPEDIDMTRRMHKHFRTMFWPEATIVHAHRASSYRSWAMLYIHIQNMIKYFNKWGWICDKERKMWNKQLLKELGYND